MAVETEVATVPELALALADSDNNRASLVPLSSNVRVAASSRCQRLHDLSILVSFLVNMLSFSGFGTSAIGAFPDGVLSLTAFEVSKDMILKYTEGLDMPEATRVSIANGVAGMLSNLVSCVYHVLLDV
eukprot:XP_024466470.1 uncharacterized protein LOC18102625 [Populus trichocarpa]